MKRSEVLKKMREGKMKPALSVKLLAGAIKKVRKHIIKPNSLHASGSNPTIKVLISLPMSLNRQLERAAQRHGISKSLMVRTLIVKNRERVKRLS